MECNDIHPGLRVRTTRLEGTEGISVHSRHIDCREENITGVIRDYVPGQGGDLWFVLQDDGLIGAYCFDEMEPE